MRMVKSKDGYITQQTVKKVCTVHLRPFTFQITIVFLITVFFIVDHVEVKHLHQVFRKVSTNVNNYGLTKLQFQEALHQLEVSFYSFQV